MNSISAEQLLARFFAASMLSTYCEDQLGKSGKGTESTLASRIVAAWSKPAPKPKRQKVFPSTQTDRTHERIVLRFVFGLSLPYLVSDLAVILRFARRLLPST